MDREQILKALRSQLKLNGHIVGIATGSGMTAKYAVMGGVDFVLALSASVYRLMGRSSLASYLCYSNSNEIVMDFATRQLLPSIGHTPVIFGLDVNDPTIHLYEYLQEVKNRGFSGIVNYPSVGMIDGQFREALEEEGVTYEKEVEAMKIAKFIGLFTIGFVFNETQAKQMASAGVDVICAHFGLTGGGLLGSKRTPTVIQARKIAQGIFEASGDVPIKMVYGGPVATPDDVRFMLKKSLCQGYIGGSAFERIPIEAAILKTTAAFKHLEDNVALSKILSGKGKPEDYVNYVRAYIDENYMKDVKLRDLAPMLHLSEAYLSHIFKKNVGRSFTEYLVRTRVNEAAKRIMHMNEPLGKTAQAVGYEDYPQFSKMFKKYIGSGPSAYMQAHINTRKLD